MIGKCSQNVLKNKYSMINLSNLTELNCFSYERGVYKSVNDKCLSWDILQKSTNKKIRATIKGLVLYYGNEYD